MADFYERMQKTSNRLLNGKGQSITLTHVAPGVYDPATGGTSAATTTVQAGTGTVLDWEAKYVDGTLIKNGDKKLLLSPLNTAGGVLTAPVLGDKVTDAAGVVYTLVEPLGTLSPAGTPVLYDCNMRI